MNNCIVNFDEFNHVVSRDFVFFQNDKMKICKQNHKLSVFQNEDIVAEISMPTAYKKFAWIENEDSPIFVFNGNKAITIDDSFCIREIEIDKVEIITNLFKQNDEYVFGNRNIAGISIVVCNIETSKKPIQTKTWKSKLMTGFKVYDKKAYAILDESFLVCHDIESGNLMWRKFHASKISENILHHNKTVFYCCQNLLKTASVDEFKTIRIPYVQIARLEQILGNRLYFSEVNKALVCYDLINNKIEWEAKTDIQVVNSVLLKGIHNGKTKNVIALQSENKILFIDAHKGQVIKTFVFPMMKSIRITNQYLIINTTSDRTVIISGDYDVSNNIV